MSTGKNNTGISVGSSSILAIFVVLCLTTFATLSLVSAQADYKLTKKTAQATAEYYAADAKAEEMLQELHKALDTDTWREQLLLLDTAITYEVVEDTLIFRYDVPVNESKTLHVELISNVDTSGKPEGNLRRLSWKVMPMQGWQDEKQINLPGISNLPIFQQKG